jgi:hypothetical protein
MRRGKNMKIKILLAVIGLAYMITGFVALLLIIFRAYQEHSKTAIVSINVFGEANLELAVLIIGIPLVIYSAAWTMIKLRKEKEEDVRRY